MWKLAGTALVFFDYDPVDLKTIAYRFTCIVFPSNAFLKSVMNFFLFRKVVLGIVEEMIDYVQSSTKEFAKGNVKPIDRYPWFSSPEGIKEREKFQQVIKGNY
jgi:hypothetical protein